MVNFKKIQNDIFKAWFKSMTSNKGVDFDIHFKFGRMGDNVWVVTDSIAMYAIPNTLFAFDYDKMLYNHTELEVDKILRCDEADLFPIEYKCEKVTADNKRVTIFTNGVSEVSTEITIDSRLLEYIDIKECTFKGKGAKHPIYAYDSISGEMVAMILPIWGARY